MFGLEELGLLGLFLGNILAATIVPFSSDALYIAVLAATRETAACFVVATIGNWLGSLVTYGMGRLGRWEWIEKWFKVKPETLEKQKRYVSKYGVWLSLIASPGPCCSGCCKRRGTQLFSESSATLFWSCSESRRLPSCGSSEGSYATGSPILKARSPMSEYRG